MKRSRDITIWQHLNNGDGLGRWKEDKMGECRMAMRGREKMTRGKKSGGAQRMSRWRKK